MLPYAGCGSAQYDMYRAATALAEHPQRVLDQRSAAVIEESLGAAAQPPAAARREQQPGDHGPAAPARPGRRPVRRRVRVSRMRLPRTRSSCPRSSRQSRIRSFRIHVRLRLRIRHEAGSVKDTTPSG